MKYLGGCESHEQRMRYRMVANKKGMRLSLLKIEELDFWFWISGLALLFVQNAKCIDFPDNKVLNPVLMLPEGWMLSCLLSLCHIGDIVKDIWDYRDFLQ